MFTIIFIFVKFLHFAFKTYRGFLTHENLKQNLSLLNTIPNECYRSTIFSRSLEGSFPCVNGPYKIILFFWELDYTGPMLDTKKY